MKWPGANMFHCEPVRSHYLHVGAHARIRIGIGGPVTGSGATFCSQSRMGVEQAVEDINASGAMLGRQLIVSAGDDAADPNQGVSVANKFAGDEVRVMRKSGIIG